MQAATGVPASFEIAGVLDEFLHSVSHDLRSPLLTISLGTELIADSLNPGDERGALALDSLRNGAKDLERLLDAVTLLSRARRRSLVQERVRVLDVLGGHRVASEHDGLDRLHVEVDPRIMFEVLAVIGGGNELTVTVDVEESVVCLAMPLPDDAPECDGSPLAGLLCALRTYAGTPIARVAGLQAQLERQGGAMTITNRWLRVSLPRSEPAS